MSIEIESTTLFWPDGLPAPLLGRAIAVNTRKWVSQMDSNRSRVRPVSEGTLRIMSANWTFMADQFSLFKEFFEDTLVQGTEIFILETTEPDADPGKQRNMTYQCAFASANYQWSQDDNVFNVQASLILDEVEYVIVNLNPDVPTSNDGLEDWTDYNNIPNGNVLNQNLKSGTGWAGDTAWLFADLETLYYGYDDFENYSDRAIIDFSTPQLFLNQGFNWGDRYDGFPSFGQNYWQGTSYVSQGKEDWESYADGDVGPSSNLNWNDTVSWENDSKWQFAILTESV